MILPPPSFTLAETLFPYTTLFLCMLHRAIRGALERVIGMLIENQAGAMPAWLSPEHAVVGCISEASASYADEIALSLKKQGFRAHSDLRGEKITRKDRTNVV